MYMYVYVTTMLVYVLTIFGTVYKPRLLLSQLDRFFFFFVCAGSLGMGAVPQSISRTFFQFSFLLLILELRVASTWVTRRDMLWDESSWLDDFIGVGVGAAGSLYDLLNQLTDTEVQPTVQSPSLPGNSLETPNEQGRLLVPSSMKRCSASNDGTSGDRSDEGADYLWDLVEQDPITGYV